MRYNINALLLRLFAGELTVEQQVIFRQQQALTQARQCGAEEQEWGAELPSQREGHRAGNFLATQACSADCLAASAKDLEQLQPSLRLATPPPSQ